jgi:penicillin-binding protein 2
VIDESNPLLNRCVSGLYSPGSTYKLLTALFMLDKMGFNINTKYFCPGFVEFGNRKFHCWKKEGHGSLDLSEAIKKSCDCYFYNLAKNIKIDDLSSFSNQFSIGKLTDIDMPDESSGLMPDSKWKKKNRGEKWQRGETLNTVIGQGFTLSTPLQITLMTARIASGKNLQPTILKRNRYFFENINVSEKNLDFIRNSMFRVVNEFEGTAFRSRLQSRQKMAGKTGTSQVRRITKEERESGVLKNEELAYKLRDHSLFTGYAPYDNPRFAITVVAEHMGNGSKVAAPISKKIIDFALRSLS